MKKNTISLILSRVALTITSVYILYILFIIISTTYRGPRRKRPWRWIWYGICIPIASFISISNYNNT